MDQMKMKMKSQIRIQDPSGETRIFPILNKGAMTLGRSEPSHVILRDPTVSKQAAVLWIGADVQDPHLSPFWLKTMEGQDPILLGDMPVREVQVPYGMSLKIGETKLIVEPDRKQDTLPDFPSGSRPWYTTSHQGQKLLWLAKKAAGTGLSVYIGGETGTGKEVIAQLIHAWSERAASPFVPLHCGALPLTLAESELFGHIKGAFTGAFHHRPGALMQAHGGTLFLDEIGDLPIDIQIKLLRFLEDGEIRPVGADRPSRADVRIVCATHHPLEKLVEEGKFRRDLYFRIASINLQIPSLRSRPEDIAMLATRFCSDMKKSLSPNALLRLQAHGWPGNVRELRHAIERACGLAGPFQKILDDECFDFLLTHENVKTSPGLEFGAPVLKLKEMERVMLLKALKLSNGNRARAAKVLGVARSTLFEMLKRHRVQGPNSTKNEL